MFVKWPRSSLDNEIKLKKHLLKFYAMHKHGKKNNVIISQTISHNFDFVAEHGARALFLLPHSKDMHIEGPGHMGCNVSQQLRPDAQEFVVYCC